MPLFLFFGSFILLILSIYLLGLITSAVDREPLEDAQESEHERSATIPDAVNAYRRSRHVHESQRARREKTTIVILGLTGIFALAAAIAAGYSAYIFNQQTATLLTKSKDSYAPTFFRTVLRYIMLMTISPRTLLKRRVWRFL